MMAAWSEAFRGQLAIKNPARNERGFQCRFGFSRFRFSYDLVARDALAGEILPSDSPLSLA